MINSSPFASRRRDLCDYTVRLEGLILRESGPNQKKRIFNKMLAKRRVIAFLMMAIPEWLRMFVVILIGSLFYTLLRLVGYSEFGGFSIAIVLGAFWIITPEPFSTLLSKIPPKPVVTTKHVFAFFVVIGASIIAFGPAFRPSVADLAQLFLLILVVVVLGLFAVSAIVLNMLLEPKMLLSESRTFSFSEIRDTSPDYIKILSYFVYLIVWALAQYFIDSLIRNFQPGVDVWILVTLQFLLAILTLLPLIAHICVSMIRTFLQARQVIQQELGRKGKTTSP